jgi:hypothetical protein
LKHCSLSIIKSGLRASSEDSLGNQSIRETLTE